MTVTAQGAPPVETYELTGRDGDKQTIRGQHLGHGTSQQGDRDRWFEVDIYSVETGFVVHTRGCSSLPGETTLSRIRRTRSAFEVVEILTVKRCVVDGRHTCDIASHEKRLYIPRQSSHALAQAAQWNDDIRDAYVNRAVL